MRRCPPRHISCFILHGMIIEHAILLARATGLSKPLGYAKAIVFPTLPAAKHSASKRHILASLVTLSITWQGCCDTMERVYGILLHQKYGTRVPPSHGTFPLRRKYKCTTRNKESRLTHTSKQYVRLARPVRRARHKSTASHCTNTHTHTKNISRHTSSVTYSRLLVFNNTSRAATFDQGNNSQCVSSDQDYTLVSE